MGHRADYCRAHSKPWKSRHLESPVGESRFLNLPSRLRQVRNRRQRWNYICPNSISAIRTAWCLASTMGNVRCLHVPLSGRSRDPTRSCVRHRMEGESASRYSQLYIDQPTQLPDSRRAGVSNSQKFFNSLVACYRDDVRPNCTIFADEGSNLFERYSLATRALAE
jgi:hypothetical protein